MDEEDSVLGYYNYGEFVIYFSFFLAYIYLIANKQQQKQQQYIKFKLNLAYISFYFKLNQINY
jgi:hypothetical protein